MRLPVQHCPAGQYFASASHDRTARVWSLERAQPLRIMAGHLSDVDCVRWHPNCNYIATGSSDKTVRLWDVQTGEAVRIFVGHKGPLTSLALSPSGRFLASGGGFWSPLRSLHQERAPIRSVLPLSQARCRPAPGPQGAALHLVHRVCWPCSVLLAGVPQGMRMEW